MSPSKKRSRAARSAQLRELARLVAAPGPEDGIPPKILDRSSLGGGRTDKALRRVARAAERRLALALLDARGDPVLAEVTIARVDPVPDGTHLRVLLVAADPQRPPAPDRVQQALARAAGWLRTEVAAALQRRRTPWLLFAYEPFDPAGEGAS